MKLRVIVGPTTEPVSVEDMLSHMRILDIPLDVNLIPGMISAAREQCEHRTGRSLVAKTLEVALPAWPGLFEFPSPPVTALVSVKYDDVDNAEQDAAGFVLVQDWMRPTLIAPTDYDYPITSGLDGCVRVRYTTGYATVPENLIAWIKMRAAALYEHRESDADRRIDRVSFVDGLMDPHEIYTV